MYNDLIEDVEDYISKIDVAPTSKKPNPVYFLVDAVKASFAKLQETYSNTDETSFNYIATILHP
eukprot:gene25101-30131_t